MKRTLIAVAAVLAFAAPAAAKKLSVGGGIAGTVSGAWGGAASFGNAAAIGVTNSGATANAGGRSGHGGGGVSDDFPLAHQWAAMRTLRFADGPDEVHNRAIARNEFGKYADYKADIPSSGDIGVSR